MGIIVKILYLLTPYRGIYPFLEKSIIHAFENYQVEVIQLDYPYKTKQIQHILETEKPELLFSLIGRKNNKLLYILKDVRIPKVGWFLEDPYFISETIAYLPLIDTIFTVEERAKEYYVRLGHNNSHYLPLGYDPSIYFPKKNVNAYRSDICLVGYPYPNRMELVTIILKKTNWNVTLVGDRWARNLRYLRRKEQVQCINKWTSPDEVATYYSNTKLILNPHREVEGSSSIKPISPNNRCFEGAACNTIQLCDWREGINTVFGNSCYFPMYKNLHQAIGIINHLLENENYRVNEAEKTFKLVQKEHTFDHRIKTIITTLNHPKS